MKIIPTILLMTLSMTSYGKTWGEKLKENVPQVQLSKLGSMTPNKVVQINGDVQKVCQKKGCWAVIKDGDREMRITFKDYSFFVPLSLEGKKIKAQGLVKKITRSVGDQKHFLKDAKASQEEIDKIKEEKTHFEFEAVAVALVN